MKQIRVRLFAMAVVASLFSAAAMADISGTATLSAGQGFNFDTGTTTSGDIVFTGPTITFVGSAKGGAIPGVTGATTYNSLTQAILLSLAAFASNAPIPANSYPMGAILALQTNGGNAAKLLVTAVSGSSISYQYTTYGASGSGGGPSVPTVTKVTNNYSYTPNGFPNSGISPSTIFTIFGSGLAAPVSGTVSLNDSSKGIPTLSNGATVSVTVGGKTVTPGLYYALPTQIAGVLPAGTPTGTGTLTVTYANSTSAAFTIQVVPAALGLDTYFGTGSGLITATNAGSGALFNYTNAASPGQTIVLWGSGLGADTQDSDTVFTSTPHAVNQSSTQIWFGGVQGTVGYAGSSGYPGLNQINVTIPSNAPTGCNVSVVGVVQGVSSNFGTLPIGQGGACSDSIFGISGTLLNTLSGQTTAKSGAVIVGQSTVQGQTSNVALATFSSRTGASYSSSGLISIGSCIVSEVISSTGSTATTTGLDAGTSIGLTGPLGVYTLNGIQLVKGTYTAQLPAGAVPSTGGSFTFKGPGGADVGAFTANVNLPNPLLSWTNQSAAGTINRAQGVPVTWSGGSPGSYVIISGSASGSGGASGSFVCYAPQSALQFTVPSYVTGTLPAGTGTLSVENGTAFATFSASGLDYGSGFGFNSIVVNSTYQ